MTSPEQTARADRVAEYEALQTEHGGYWRHGFVDHAYLYNLYFPPESLFDEFRERLHDLVLNYPVAQNVLAGLLGRLIGQPPERLVVANGAAEIIKIVSGHLATRLIIPVPSFNEYANACPPGVAVEFVLDAPGFALDVDRFASEAIAAGADLAVVVSPNNPTSMMVPRADLVRLLSLLEDHGCMLLVDESFIDFSGSGHAESLEQDLAGHRNLAVIKSVSKAYGICGLRIGYLATANSEFAERVRDGLHIWNLNGFAEEFLRVAPAYRREFVESCEAVRGDAAAFHERLNSIPGLRVYRPDANFVFCRLPDEAPSGPEVALELFVEHNILVKDTAGKTMPEADRYLRLACRTRPENESLAAALATILTREASR